MRSEPTAGTVPTSFHGRSRIEIGDFRQIITLRCGPCPLGPLRRGPKASPISPIGDHLRCLVRPLGATQHIGTVNDVCQSTDDSRHLVDAATRRGLDASTPGMTTPLVLASWPGAIAPGVPGRPPDREPPPPYPRRPRSTGRSRWARCSATGPPRARWSGARRGGRLRSRRAAVAPRERPRARSAALP
jgi:hypothetical protein